MNVDVLEISVAIGVAVTLVVAMILGLAGLIAPAFARYFLTAWTFTVTWPWPARIRNRRRLETRSHIHEHFHDPSVAGHSASQLAALLIVQAIIGMPSDAIWAVRGLLDRGRRARAIATNRVYPSARTITVTRTVTERALVDGYLDVEMFRSGTAWQYLGDKSANSSRLGRGPNREARRRRDAEARLRSSPAARRAFHHAYRKRGPRQ